MQSTMTSYSNINIMTCNIIFDSILDQNSTCCVIYSLISHFMCFFASRNSYSFRRPFVGKRYSDGVVVCLFGGWLVGWLVCRLAGWLAGWVVVVVVGGGGTHHHFRFNCSNFCPLMRSPLLLRAQVADI